MSITNDQIRFRYWYLNIGYYLVIDLPARSPVLMDEGRCLVIGAFST